MDSSLLTRQVIGVVVVVVLEVVMVVEVLVDVVLVVVDVVAVVEVAVEEVAVVEVAVEEVAVLEVRVMVEVLVGGGVVRKRHSGGPTTYEYDEAPSCFL
eukprot:CAMPEP_0180469254 /NCGR_PEP_ID=MMETSP1036_2-20121128/27956_1 /TAXON_ID=632150 /ORGANISM="Azadinium spinosum, Strain 3D9" /LENGTH=98 /DNA_ID=CAMNT_0022476313 /DNA_START=950 /DNA_END=1246 /DNA_ORIENTATION=-